jgi:uncharacterized OsmC-like protein
MNVSVQYMGNTRFEAVARGHRVVCDQPVENGGEDAGMTPPEFLLASLGTCAGYYAAQYLNARKLPSGGLAVSVAAEKRGATGAVGVFPDRDCGAGGAGRAASGGGAPGGEVLFDSQYFVGPAGD